PALHTLSLHDALPILSASPGPTAPAATTVANPRRRRPASAAIWRAGPPTFNRAMMRRIRMAAFFVNELTAKAPSRQEERQGQVRSEEHTSELQSQSNL